MFKVETMKLLVAFGPSSNIIFHEERERRNTDCLSFNSVPELVTNSQFSATGSTHLNSFPPPSDKEEREKANEKLKKNESET